MTRSPSRPPRPARLALPVVAALLAACATAPAEPPLPQLTGEYTGSVSVGGESLFGSLAVTQEGAEIALRFSFPDFALTARGEGTVGESGFRAEVPYTLTCPGTARLDGRVEEEGRILRGTLEALDCTGSMDGTFRFTRRD